MSGPDSPRTLGILRLGGDWACAHGDFAALRDVALQLADQVAAPLRADLRLLAEACREDLDRAAVLWVRIEHHISDPH